MPTERFELFSRIWRYRWLRLIVHLDAFRLAPIEYLGASWWRLIGKRVRARAHFAPLLGQSSLSYGLWQTTEESLDEDVVTSGFPSLVALVEQGSCSRSLERTLFSLASENVQAHVLPSGGLPEVAEAEARDESGQPWFMEMQAGDILAPGAGNFYRALAANTSAEIIYSDDDLIVDTGQRRKPHFKPEWNKELFRHLDYLTGASFFKCKWDVLVSSKDGDVAGSVVRRLALADGAKDPLHVPKILHHRVSRPALRMPAAPTLVGHSFPSVSVIVPTRNRSDLLRKCLEGLDRTDYPNMEVIVVDNGSDDSETLAFLAGLNRRRYRVECMPGPFNFSRLNNRAARLARGTLLCLLNNDIEVIAPDWLKILSLRAVRSKVGAVGARLLYPNGLIQHAGVVTGIGGGAAHAHRLLPPDAEGYFHRHSLPQVVSAVTAACLVVQRDRFWAVNGFDEDHFAVAFNDVDLCMKLNRMGWLSYYEPSATLIHHESVSRGLDKDPKGSARLASELATLKERWLTDVSVDPYHHSQLSPFSERFVVRL